jgi:hypothetical protein
MLASGIENIRLRRDGEDPLVAILFIIKAIEINDYTMQP